ncbi:MAG: hypothetical protein IH881_12965 [Myxococcales bacterium]|nr:hypothetical protein [Myxococcales bacterium]
MESSEVLVALLELAGEVNLEVRILRGLNSADTEFPPTSSCCRVKGKVWVVLSPNDPVAFHIEVLSQALRSEAGTVLADRYLPPAIRQLLD